MILEKIPAKKSGFNAICKCDTCNKIFIRGYHFATRREHQFCSKKCWAIFAGNNHKTVEKRCLECGKIMKSFVLKKYCPECEYKIKLIRKKLDYKKHIDKRKKTTNKWYLNNKEYINELNKKARDIKEFGGNRSKVLERDNYQCQICGSKDKLVIHHIDKTGRGAKEHNNSLYNLITLCRKCHISLHKEDLKEGLKV